MDRAFEHQELPRAMANIRRLASLTTVFPDPDQMIWVGHKLTLSRELMRIAKEHTHTPFPTILEIHDALNFASLQRTNLYIKREFSEASDHAVRVKPNDIEFLQTYANMVEDSNEIYKHETMEELGIKVRWFGMSYIDELQTLGELRTFFVGGQLSHTVLTEAKGAGCMEDTPVTHLTPLKLIESVFGMQFYSKSNSDTRILYARRTTNDPNFTLANPMATREELEIAEHEFKYFAITTFQKLVDAQEQQFGTGNSMLRVLCRLDISVIRDQSGRLSYFVNEVSKSLRTVLFLSSALNAQSSAMDIAIALRTLVAVRRSIKATWGTVTPSLAL